MRLKPELRAYVVGNVVERNLSDLWNDPEYVAFRKRIQGFDFSPCTICGGCELSEANEEDCFGNTFPTCGGCLWAQGVIQYPWFSFQEIALEEVIPSILDKSTVRKGGFRIWLGNR
jgi:hypothetical protein